MLYYVFCEDFVGSPVWPSAVPVSEQAPVGTQPQTFVFVCLLCCMLNCGNCPVSGWSCKSWMAKCHSNWSARKGNNILTFSDWNECIWGCQVLPRSSLWSSAPPAYPTSRAVNTCCLAPKSLHTMGKLLATAIQAGHQTGATDHDWRLHFLLHLLDVLLTQCASNLPDAAADSESSANGLQKCHTSLAKCSCGQRIRVTRSLQSSRWCSREPGFTAGSRYTLPGCPLRGVYWSSHMAHRELMNSEPDPYWTSKGLPWEGTKLFVVWYQERYPFKCNAMWI